MPYIRLLPIWIALLAGSAGAQAQTRFTIDPRASLAWWQVNPHLNHLWATTCPADPSWRPGEGRSSGWIIGQNLPRAKHGYANVSDTTIVPLYPRKKVQSICTEAVEGYVQVADTASWQGIQGEVSVRGDALITGEERRDAYTRQAILQIDQYPEIKFRIDSVVDVTREADTLRGTAVGMLFLHGVRKPMTGPVSAWPEAGGLRVLSRLRMPAEHLTQEFGFSRFALGLGVTTGIWHDVFMGIDVVLRQR